MSLVESQLAALREIEQLWPEANAVVIGATALGFYFDMTWRYTADVDFVVALTVDELPALANRPGWSRHPKREYEFTSPDGAKVDLIPAGLPLMQAGKLQWRNGDVMSLAGMDLAFRHAVRHEGGVFVAPPPVVAILKMVAFADRPTERERDLVAESQHDMCQGSRSEPMRPSCRKARPNAGELCEGATPSPRIAGAMAPRRRPFAWSIGGRGRAKLAAEQLGNGSPCVS
jgi:hypothetical protein